ncbi:MAG TPA: hypothetical protein VI451_07810 [Anaerolineales bacterium]|nr:hypothetical protein [Anaerolineales bacterium]
MNTPAIKKTEIIRDLARIPDNKLDSVRKYIDSILAESKQRTRKNQSLKGIWKDAGFEKIADLEEEIKNTKKQLSDSILKRQL